MAADQRWSRDDSDDPQLVDACRAGDRRALERLFRIEAPHLRRLTASLVGPGGLDIDDVLQATFLAAIRGFSRFRGEASVRTWLTKIAVRTAHEQLQRGAVRRSLLTPLDESGPEPADPMPGADDRIDDQVRLQRLHGILDGIEPKKRVAFMLHVVHGHSIQEVAELMDSHSVLVKARIARARRTLLKHAARDPWLRELVAPPGKVGPDRRKDGR